MPWKDWLKKIDPGNSLIGKVKDSPSPMDVVKKALQKSAEGTGNVVEYTGQLYDRWLGEDRAEILEKCPVATGILAYRHVCGQDFDLASQLFNVRTRPVFTAMILSATGGGLLAFEEELSRLTKHVFDGQQLYGKWGKEFVENLVGQEKYKIVSEWQDKPPGFSVIGGGETHRVLHGHDLSAVLEAYQEHGLDGAIVTLYHIFGRDFFTKAGIPILPSGSDEAFNFLTENFEMGKEAAADLLSINCIELVGGFLTGFYTTTFVFRLASLAKSVRENSIVQDRVARARQMVEVEDYLSAVNLLDDALSYRHRDGILKFLLATLHHRSENKLQAHLAYHDVCASLAGDEPMIELNGARLSLRGIASTGALSTSEALCRAEQYKDSWLKHVIAVARAGIAAFETVGNNLRDRRPIKRFSSPNLLPPRSLSAALNYYLAGRLAGAAMFLPDREHVLSRLTRKVDEALEETKNSTLLYDRIEDLRFIKMFTKAELLGMRGISNT